MRILILGGTRFVGRHIAEAAIAAGHDVAFANRGMTDVSLFGPPRFVFDRYGDASALREADAEIVIDVSGYTPDSVRASAKAVADSVQRYVFVSSIDAYDLHYPDASESSPTKRLEADASTSEPIAELYGAHKVRCEELLVETLGVERVLVVRAGLMMGPFDHTDRFTYWPVRIARGGDVVLPVGRTMPVQIIDVRDVAAWTVRAVERDLHGTYTTVGPPGALTFGDVLDACERVSGTAPRYRWASSQFLKLHDVGPWVEMPLWVPDVPELHGLRSIRNDRAWAAGLRFRPLEETVRDVLAEYRARPDAELAAGLTVAREAELLAALRTDSGDHAQAAEKA